MDELTNEIERIGYIEYVETNVERNADWLDVLIIRSQLLQK